MPLFPEASEIIISPLFEGLPVPVIDWTSPMYSGDGAGVGCSTEKHSLEPVLNTVYIMWLLKLTGTTFKIYLVTREPTGSVHAGLSKSSSVAWVSWYKKSIQSVPTCKLGSALPPWYQTLIIFPNTSPCIAACAWPYAGSEYIKKVRACGVCAKSCG